MGPQAKVTIGTTLVMNEATGRAMVLGEISAGDELLRAFVAEPGDVGIPDAGLELEPPEETR